MVIICLDRHELVLVTHIRDPCQFMIQRVADMEQLQIMMNIINIYCDSTENVHDLLYDVKFGMLLTLIISLSWYMWCDWSILQAVFHCTAR